jgi:sec-independent protein translocase protein TatB
MFGIDSSELAIIALVALLVIGPKDLPRVMRMVGQWMSKGRAMTRHVRAGFDTMMREAELEDMQKQWAAQNEAIMKATALPDLTIASPVADTGADDWKSPMPPLAPDVIPDVINLAPAAPAAKPRRARAKPAAKSPAKSPAKSQVAATLAAPKRQRTVRSKPDAEAVAGEAVTAASGTDT